MALWSRDEIALSRRSWQLFVMNDTSPQADEVRLRLFRAMSPERKLSTALSWSTALREMIRAKIKVECSGATEAQQRRLLADRWLGPELAAKVYGPLAGTNG
jgi:hypothetical protein